MENIRKYYHYVIAYVLIRANNFRNISFRMFYIEISQIFVFRKNFRHTWHILLDKYQFCWENLRK